MTTGYEEKDSGEKKDIPSPNDVTWTCELDHVAESKDDGDTVFCRIEIDNQTVGMLRLPNSEYLEWIRIKLKKEQFLLIVQVVEK